MPKYDGKVSAAAGKDEFRKAAETALDNATVETARENLAAVDENYRNLTKEYRDGILLFDVSNDRVWDRSNKDTKGLEDFFNLHRANYSWDAPRYKGVIVSATNDSIADAAKAYLKANPVGLDSIVAKLRDQFGRNVRSSASSSRKVKTPLSTMSLSEARSLLPRENGLRSSFLRASC